MNRWDRAGRVAGYGAALAMTPYLVIKVSWVVGSLAGLTPTGTSLSTAEWVAINTVTIGMAGVAIVVALALVMPWGMRLPGAPLAFCAWVGTGFLVPLLPYAVLTSMLAAGGGGGEDSSAMPAWEGALIQMGFVGMGLGLAVALPAYMRRRWPNALAGRLGDRTRTVPGLRLALPVGVAIALLWAYWAAGGTAGLVDPGNELDSRLLAAISGIWALVAAGATWMVSSGRPGGVARGVPMVLGWLGSGSLFAWSAWKLVLTVYVAVAGPAGPPAIRIDVALALHVAGVLAGAAMGWALVRSNPAPESDVRVGGERLHA